MSSISKVTVSATKQIAKTGLSTLPPVIYYSEQQFRLAPDAGALREGANIKACLHESLGHPIQHVIGT